MSDRVSHTVLLCEDDPQEQLVRRYLEKCGHRTGPRDLIPRNASRSVQGGNVGWVLKQFPEELKFCRRRNVRVRTRLIVVADADNFTVDERRGHLDPDGNLTDADPVMVLIPKRHIETWIRAALGQAVNELDDYKKPELGKSQIRDAASQIHGWARDNPVPAPTCVPSLRQALPEWRKIG
jgi:hypothetical protein